jgi:hypothetical protein
MLIWGRNENVVRLVVGGAVIGFALWLNESWRRRAATA